MTSRNNTENVDKSVGTAFVAMPLFELVEAILSFEKSSSDAEL